MKFRNLPKLTIVFLLSGQICLIDNVSYAQGVEIAASIGADQLMNNVIDKARSAIASILDKIDDSVGSATFLTKMQLANILSELDFRSKEVVGKTFAEINQSQKVFFSNLVSTIDQINAMGDNVAENANTVLTKSQTLLAMVPFADKEPRLTLQRPNVTVDSDVLSSKQIDISFDGSFLAHGEPKLTIEKNRCDIKKSSDFGIVFSCKIPEEWFNSPSSNQYIKNISGNLDVALEQNFWKKLTGIFHSNITYKTYMANVTVIPEKFATFTTHLVQENNKNVFQDRSGLFDSGAKHCVSGSSSIANLSPSGPGWQIDVGSIQVMPKSCNNGGAMPINVTAGGFQVRAWGTNSGSCGPFGIGKDARGWCNGTVSWKEFRSEAAPTEINLPDRDLKWGERMVSVLPDRSTKIVTQIRMFDGKIREYEQTGFNEFFRYNLSPDNKSLSIEPKSIQNAFK